MFRLLFAYGVMGPPWTVMSTGSAGHGWILSTVTASRLVNTANA